MSLFNNSNVHLHMTTDSFDATTLLTGSDSSIFYALLFLLGTVIADSSSSGRHSGDNWKIVIRVLCGRHILISSKLCTL